MISSYSKSECLAILTGGSILLITFAILGLWWLTPFPIIATFAGIAFFRDPERRIPSQRGAVIAPADGRVSSIHNLEKFPPFADKPAVCIRIFMSVFDVHVNRAPCHGKVASITHKPGKHQNTLNPQSAEDNESNLVLLIHPTRKHPVAAVRQIAGLLARTIHCAAKVDQIFQRGERFGLIKLGSTTELYLPQALSPELQITKGQKVRAGQTVLAHVRTPHEPFNAPGRDTHRKNANNADPSENTASPAPAKTSTQ